MVQRLENLPATGGQHRGNANEEGKFRGRWPAQTEQQTKHNRRAGTRCAGTSAGDELAHCHRHRHRPSDFGAKFFAAQKKLHGEKRQATDEQRDGHRRGIFRQFKALFIQHEADCAGDAEGDEDFQQVVERFLLPELKDEFINALRKQRQHGDDRAALDDDIVEVGFFDVQDPLGDEQMAGGGNRNEFSNALDDAEDEVDEPVVHK